MPLVQTQTRASGHSIECRICAEEPDNNFLPATGVIRPLHAPVGPHPSGSRARFAKARESERRFRSDAGETRRVGTDRSQAIDRMVAALRELTVLGLRTNIDYLVRILRTNAFRSGSIHTGFVVEQAAELAPSPRRAATAIMR